MLLELQSQSYKTDELVSEKFQILYLSVSDESFQSFSIMGCWEILLDKKVFLWINEGDTTAPKNLCFIPDDDDYILFLTHTLKEKNQR